MRTADHQRKEKEELREGMKRTRGEGKWKKTRKWPSVPSPTAGKSWNKQKVRQKYIQQTNCALQVIADGKKLMNE